ncbi:hypothetical protein NLU13_7126 [Sarocladium strictum]|uniref:Uncharacterized protein n=1 Tax=Sarocladium strictum TaxID=5046 RepID=A0AA39L658_SARSR|nr:hypothetical protein NLU13_7126 [Sarocladium strictum]
MAFSDLAENDPLRLMLMTPREGHLFDDGVVFTRPRALKDVPLARITEDHEYWQRGWKSLDRYIAGEQQQEKEKERYRILEASITSATSTEQARKIKERAKLHSDNVVAVEYLPAEGLCEQEIMYKLACKISDLQVLSLKGELNMDPFDFIRWRIALKITQDDIWKRGPKNNPVRSIITKLGDDGPPGSGKQYEDPLFRAAILRSARYQGTSNKYGAKKHGIHPNANGHADSSTVGRSDSVRRRREHAEVRRGTASGAPHTETKEEMRARIRARRIERARLSNTGYTGTARRNDGS